MPEQQGNFDYLMDGHNLNVMITGSGAREHALAWALRRSPRVGKMFIAPGGWGTGLEGKNVPITEIEDLVSFAKDRENSVDLVIVGPDDDVTRGVGDAFRANGVATFCPSQNAGQLEGSKPFAKGVMSKAGVPTADYGSFDNPQAAHAYIDRQEKPRYIKAGGNALGKGAIEALTNNAAHQAVKDIMEDKIFGDAGNEAVIEDLLIGQEVSLHALCGLVEGKVAYQMLEAVQDHKKVGIGDTGKNTGGLGTISPVPWFTQEHLTESGLSVVKPTLEHMHAEGNTYEGLLYPGLMIQEIIETWFNMNPNVLEYNARFGDPEIQVQVRRLITDLLDLVAATVCHRLDQLQIDWSSDYAVNIVGASKGYPDKYPKGKKITGIERAQAMKNVVVFGAGIVEEDGELYSNGGRVLGVSATAPTLQGALDLGYAAMGEIQFEDDTKYVRPDIGRKALEYLKAA